MTKTQSGKLSKRALFDLLGYQPHSGQIAIHRSRAPRRVVACGVRWGKTLCAAMEGIAAALAPADRSVGWVVAPTYDLADRVFREIQVVILEKLRHRILTMREHDRVIVIQNLAGGRSEIRAKSADNPVSLLGEGLDWVVVDEAARLKPAIWQNHLSQRLIDRRGWALLISTPKGKGYYYDLFQLGQGRDPDYASWNMPSWTNPLLDREVIEEERARVPERVFRQEYGAEFIEGSGSVFRYVREAARGEWQPPVKGKVYFAGLDLAKVTDYTVLTIMDSQKQVVFVDRFHRLDWGLQVERIRAACDRYNYCGVLCDSTGVGEPVYESLSVAGCYADGYSLTARSKDAIIKNLAMLLERQEIVLPRVELFPEMVDELEAFEYSVTEQGNVRTGAPGGMHDDCVISLALAAWKVINNKIPTFGSWRAWGQ
ncbi:MAG TPA: terminase family protein [Planctomycetota bacterium]|nr:terminase family protein [Planctomycetota bacterium]